VERVWRGGSVLGALAAALLVGCSSQPAAPDRLEAPAASLVDASLTGEPVTGGSAEAALAGPSADAALAAEARRAGSLIDQARARALAEGPAAAPAPRSPAAVAATVERTSALLERAERRAFDGAPPVMPHSTSFVAGRFECLDCHREGMQLGTRVARAMSHPELPACQQCHIEAQHIVFGASEAAPDTDFTGLGQRVPPPVPHGLVLRERCLGCHGPLQAERLADADRDWRGRELPSAPRILGHHPGDELARDCLDCHLSAADAELLGLHVEPPQQVGHPLGGPGFEACLDCHRRDAHAALDTAAAATDGARSACLGCHAAFASPDGALPAPTAPLPPRIPHRLFMRERCLSCHGEHGAAGLAVEHASRSQCLQCHLPRDGSRSPATTRPP